MRTTGWAVDSMAWSNHSEPLASCLPDSARAGQMAFRRGCCLSGAVCQIACLLFAATCGSAAAVAHDETWAILVGASRYWFNYRHVANTWSLYRTVKRLGIRDDHIILMLADDVACNPRNPHPGRVFKSANQQLNLHDATAEIDYRGTDVTREALLALLRGDHPTALSVNKRLLSTNTSRVLVYLTGHGGDGFLKFQDKGELQATELADAFAQMWAQGRYASLLFITDTCQASSLYKHFRSPNIVAMASSDIDEDSYSHHSDHDVGVAVMDRFTFYLLEFFEHLRPDSSRTLQQLCDHMRSQPLHSTFCLRVDLFPWRLHSVPVTTYFGHTGEGSMSPEAEDVQAAGRAACGKEDDGMQPPTASHQREGEAMAELQELLRSGRLQGGSQQALTLQPHASVLCTLLVVSCTALLLRRQSC